MAEPVVLVGEVLVELLREGFARLRPRAHLFLEHLRTAAEPPPGVSFHTEDGSAYTGLVMLDHNQVTAMLTARSEPVRSPRHESRERLPLVTRPPSPTHYVPSQRSFDDPDEPDDREWHEPPGYSRYK